MKQQPISENEREILLQIIDNLQDEIYAALYKIEDDTRVTDELWKDINNESKKTHSAIQTLRNYVEYF